MQHYYHSLIQFNCLRIQSANYFNNYTWSYLILLWPQYQTHYWYGFRTWFNLWGVFQEGGNNTKAPTQGQILLHALNLMAASMWLDWHIILYCRWNVFLHQHGWVLWSILKSQPSISDVTNKCVPFAQQTPVNIPLLPSALASAPGGDSTPRGSPTSLGSLGQDAACDHQENCGSDVTRKPLNCYRSQSLRQEKF